MGKTEIQKLKESVEQVDRAMFTLSDLYGQGYAKAAITCYLDVRRVIDNNKRPLEDA